MVPLDPFKTCTKCGHYYATIEEWQAAPACGVPQDDGYEVLEYRNCLHCPGLPSTLVVVLFEYLPRFGGSDCGDGAGASPMQPGLHPPVRSI